MSRVLLIKPRYIGPEFQSVSHPLGLMHIAAALRPSGHDVRIHDCASSPFRHRRLAELINAWRPELVGISLIVSELDTAASVTSVVRNSLPGTPIVLGGPWPSANPDAAIERFGADFVVAGEGEIVFPALVEAIRDGHAPSDITRDIPGVFCRVDGITTGSRAGILTEEQLETLGFPAWDLIDRRIYARIPSMAGTGCGDYMTVMTSRGCPFMCAYCHQTLGKRFRARSAESVLAELDELHGRFGYSEFEIVDDCFNLDRERMSAILEGIATRLPGARLHFPNGLRSDRLEPADIKLMRRAGTVSACFAIETATPELQKLIGKNLDIGKARAAIECAVSQGIFSTGFFMLGLPTETLDQATATIDFASNLPIHRAIFMLTTPFPGTPLADMTANILKERGISQAGENLNYFTRGVNVSAMTDDELNRVFRDSYRRFYLDPRRVARILAAHPRKLSLPRYGLMTLAKVLPGVWRTGAGRT
ncbi:MAG TPA: radical SAM protein [Myxococcota bacterium]|nr:radical SAM protein [Myxococcota bacterium]